MSENTGTSEGLKNQGRRKAMKKIAAGAAALAGYSVLPQRWTTPVIDVMALPAHAQGSGTGSASGNYQVNQLKLSILDGNQSSSVVTVGVEGQLSPAMADQDVELDFEAVFGSAETGVISKALAAAGSFFVSDAVAKCGKMKIKTKTKADGKFKAKCNLACGPGVVQVYVYIIIIGIYIQPITKIIDIPTTPTTTDPPGTTCAPGATCAPGTTAAPGGGTGGGPSTPCMPGLPCGGTPDPNLTNPKNPFKP